MTTPSPTAGSAGAPRTDTAADPLTLAATDPLAPVSPGPLTPVPPALATAAQHVQIFAASTLYGAATLAAALDSGLFPAADRRILLVSNNTANPETTPPLDAMPGFAPLRARFDEVVHWNAAIRPLHPGSWEPRDADVPLWERYLRLLWRLPEAAHVSLVVESIQVSPSRALVQLFPDAPLHVYADGLMSYGPTRNKLDPLVGTRIERLLHPDLLPGVRPLLLTEFGTPPETVPTAAMKKVLAELAGTAPADLPGLAAFGDEPPALLLGQYMSALGILTAEEEERLHVRMLRGAARLGHRAVVFKPHPMAPERVARLLEDEAETLGVRLAVVDTPVLAEVLYERLRPALVAGAFSTALLTAASLYGLPVARIGTDMLLERIAPYQNSNRVPVTVVDALLPALEDPAAVRAWQPPTEAEAQARLGGLLTAVGFSMQPQIYPLLRDDAARWLSTELNATTWRYFKRRRLTSLGLPGGIPPRLAFIPRNRAVRRVARRARALRKRLP